VNLSVICLKLLAFQMEEKDYRKDSPISLEL
jgi:hypothetical protein